MISSQVERKKSGVVVFTNKAPAPFSIFVLAYAVRGNRDFLSISTNDKQAILRAYASEQMSDLILQKRTIPYSRKKAS